MRVCADGREKEIGRAWFMRRSGHLVSLGAFAGKTLHEGYHWLEACPCRLGLTVFGAFPSNKSRPRQGMA